MEECCYVEFYYAGCQLKILNAECLSNKCRYAECHYTKCHGALRFWYPELGCQNQAFRI
jgi:hypothetical protein